MSPTTDIQTHVLTPGKPVSGVQSVYVLVNKNTGQITDQKQSMRQLDAEQADAEYAEMGSPYRWQKA